MRQDNNSSSLLQSCRRQPRTAKRSRNQLDETRQQLRAVCFRAAEDSSGQPREAEDHLMRRDTNSSRSASELQKTAQDSQEKQNNWMRRDTNSSRLLQSCRRQLQDSQEKQKQLEETRHQLEQICFRAEDNRTAREKRRRSSMRRDTNLSRSASELQTTTQDSQEKQKIIDETRHQLRAVCFRAAEDNPGQPREAEDRTGETNVTTSERRRHSLEEDKTSKKIIDETRQQLSAAEDSRRQESRSSMRQDTNSSSLLQSCRRQPRTAEKQKIQLETRHQLEQSASELQKTAQDSQEKQKITAMRHDNNEQSCFRAMKTSPGQPREAETTEETRHQLEQTV